MPNIDKIEKDFEESNHTVEKIANEELLEIKRKAAQIKREAEKIGEAVEFSMTESETKTAKKKG